MTAPRRRRLGSRGRCEEASGISAAVVPAAAGEYEGRVFVRACRAGGRRGWRWRRRRSAWSTAAPPATGCACARRRADVVRDRSAGPLRQPVRRRRRALAREAGARGGGGGGARRRRARGARHASRRRRRRRLVHRDGDARADGALPLGDCARRLAGRGVEAPPAALLPGGPWTLRGRRAVDGSRCAVDGVTCAAGGAPGGELARCRRAYRALGRRARQPPPRPPRRHARRRLRASFVLARGGGDDDDGSDDDDDDEAEALWARGAAVSEAEAAQEGWAVELHAAALDALRTSRVPTHDAAPAGAAGAGDGAADRGCVCVCVGACRRPARRCSSASRSAAPTSAARPSGCACARAACARYRELVGAPAAPVVAGGAAEFALRLRDAQGNWCGRRARADARVRLLLRGPRA